MPDLIKNIDIKSLIIGALVTFIVGKFTDFFDSTVTQSQLNAIARKIVDEPDYRKVLIDEIKQDNRFKGQKGDAGEPNLELLAKELNRQPGQLYELLSYRSQFEPTSKDRKYDYSKFCALASFAVIDESVTKPSCHLKVNESGQWSIKVNGASCAVSCTGNPNRT